MMVTLSVFLSVAMGYTPPTDCKTVAAPATGGRTLRCTSAFPSMGYRSYTVYLPAGFEKGSGLPVLIFMQTGEPYALGFFKKLGIFPALGQLFLRSEVQKFVLATPDQVMSTEAEASRIYYVTGTTGKFAKWHKFVTKEFPALVWKRVMGMGGGRPRLLGIDGISLGGYNAIQYALSNLTVFNVAACMSAAFYGPGVGFADKKLQMQTRYSASELSAVKGRVDTGLLKLRLQTSGAKDNTGKTLDSGPSTREVSARWIAAGIEHEVQIDGDDPTPDSVNWKVGHKSAYWASFIASRMEWHAAAFKAARLP